MIVPPDNISPPDLARLAVESFIGNAGMVLPPPNPVGVLAERSGAFVTLRELSGSLRGCIGTIEPVCLTVAAEIIQNAISAATSDPRFPRVRRLELSNLTYGVDVLSEAESVDGFDALDPAIFGVTIEARDGRRGLLLPCINGIDTVDQQWKAVHAKARIAIGEAVSIKRFTVIRFGKE